MRTATAGTLLIALLRLVACRLLASALLLGTGTRPATAEPPTGEFTDVRGGQYRLPGPDDCKAFLLLFLGHDCPVSNGYAPEVGRLCQEYTPKGVAFCVVYADADLGVADARKHAKEYGFPCPAVLDPTMRLALKVGATVKPEAAVLSPKGELLYLGRIDDTYADLGKRRPQPTRRELKDALDAVLAGKPVAVARAKAVGCPIDFPEAKK